MVKRISFVVIILVIIMPFCFADKLKLKDREAGSEVEILEENSNDFVVRIPKDEIESITRSKPTEADLWKQKRVLWEDIGDYLVISIPKERVSTAGEVKTLEDALTDSGVKKTETGLSSTGSRIVGKVMKEGQPQARCLVKIVMAGGRGWGLFGSGKGKKQGEVTFSAITDVDGKYEFKNVPSGDYDVYWKASSEGSWIRKLSEKPNITVETGQTVEYSDIIIK